MKQGLTQQTGLWQELRINPRLYQAMDLLYMPLLDLQQHLKQELLGNPFLELEEPEEETEVPLPDETGSKTEERDADEPDWENILLDDGPEGAGLSRDFSEAREYVEPVPVETKDLADHLRDFRPGPQRKVGVLVDHLVPGSKESRIADGIARSAVGQHVLIVGHPFIDIWAAVKPERLGLRKWPDVPRHLEWKKGVCQQLGWPHRDQADIARAWQHILGRVGSFHDLDPALLGRVEELIDFVTA